MQNKSVFDIIVTEMMQEVGSAELLEDLEPGDYVMVHAGVAIAKITDDDANETMGILKTHAR